MSKMSADYGPLRRHPAARDQPAPSDLLRAIVEGTGSDTGEEFFRSLVKHLAQALKVRYAFVGEWRQEIPATVCTLALWSGAAFAEPFTYSLRNTPCDNVLNQRLCLYESGVQRLFPEDQYLVQMGVDSYCGMPLFNKSGHPLGVLVVMDDRPMTYTSSIKDLLQIFGASAAAELQRQRLKRRCARARKGCGPTRRNWSRSINLSISRCISRKPPLKPNQIFWRL